MPFVTYVSNSNIMLYFIPATIPWLARSIIPVRPALKIAFWPQLRKARDVVVFREATSYFFRTLSYWSASNFSLLKYWRQNWIFFCKYLTGADTEFWRGGQEKMWDKKCKWISRSGTNFPQNLPHPGHFFATCVPAAGLEFTDFPLFRDK